jgi:DNA-binding response OmpR family regulator
MPPHHLLIVDDSAAVTGALGLLFQESGFRVTTAGDVDDAVRAGTADRADVLLLDLTLPGGDGLLVLEQLRARGAEPRTTFALTGHDDDALRERCIAAGCRDVLVKPVPIRQLLALVRSL